MAYKTDGKVVKMKGEFPYTMVEDGEPVGELHLAELGEGDYTYCGIDLLEETYRKKNPQPWKTDVITATTILPDLKHCMECHDKALNMVESLVNFLGKTLDSNGKVT